MGAAPSRRARTASPARSGPRRRRSRRGRRRRPQHNRPDRGRPGWVGAGWGDIREMVLTHHDGDRAGDWRTSSNWRTRSSTLAWSVRRAWTAGSTRRTWMAGSTGSRRTPTTVTREWMSTAIGWSGPRSGRQRPRWTSSPPPGTCSVGSRCTSPTNGCCWWATASRPTRTDWPRPGRRIRRPGPREGVDTGARGLEVERVLWVLCNRGGPGERVPADIDAVADAIR